MHHNGILSSQKNRSLVFTKHCLGPLFRIGKRVIHAFHPLSLDDHFPCWKAWSPPHSASELGSRRTLSFSSNSSFSSKTKRILWLGWGFSLKGTILPRSSYLQVRWFPVLQGVFEFAESHVWSEPRVGKEEGRGFLSDLKASTKLRRRTIEKEVNKEVKGNWRLKGKW